MNISITPRIEEFFNKNHSKSDGRFSSGSGGSGGADARRHDREVKADAAFTKARAKDDAPAKAVVAKAGGLKAFTEKYKTASPAEKRSLLGLDPAPAKGKLLDKAGVDKATSILDSDVAPKMRTNLNKLAKKQAAENYEKNFVAARTAHTKYAGMAKRTKNHEDQAAFIEASLHQHYLMNAIKRAHYGA